MSSPLPPTPAASGDSDQLLQNEAMSSRASIPTPEVVELASTSAGGDKENSVERIDGECTPTFSVLEILPEIWRSNIFPYLQPTGFQSVINSSPWWWSWFKPERTDMLLPLVLPVVLKNCGMSKSSELLVWRGVNKAAKSIVDNLLEESSSPQNYQDDRGINSPLWFPVIRSAEDDLRLVIEQIKHCYNFSNVRQLQQFVDLIHSAPGVSSANPFLTKSVNLGTLDPVDLPDQLLLPLFQRYGHLIHSCNFWNCTDIPFLFSIVSQLPNLRILIVDGMFDSEDLEDIGRLPQVHLSNLEILDVRTAAGDGSVLAPLLTGIGPQLHTLVWAAVWDHDDAILERLGQGIFPNIRTIQVEAAEIAYLHRLFGLDFPLQFQAIVVNTEKVSFLVNPPSFADLIGLIGPFATTLTQLTHNIPVRADQNMVPVSLSNLATLTINWNYIFERWLPDFLRHQVPQLTEVNLILDTPTSSYPPFIEIWESIQEQQLFENVPTLQRINVSRRFQTTTFLTERKLKVKKMIIERSGVRTILCEQLVQE